MICGLIGEKLSHSYSKRIHNRIADYDYALYSLPPEALAAFLQGEYRGMNVTIPYKKAVIPFCDTLSDTARTIGSVNTLVRDKDGLLHGYNTDSAGFLSMAARAGISFQDKKVLILGTGGTSLTVSYAVRQAGARETVLVSRNGPIHYGNVSEKAGDAQILVNTTPCGMFPHNGGRLLDLSKFPLCCGVLGVVYNPLRTQLILDAQALGIPCSGGLPMLVAQAVEASRLFTGTPLPTETTETVLRELLAETENIVLIGMPGSGKSSVGAAVAERLNRELLDTDLLIEKSAGMRIPEIFARFGEAEFRKLERTICAECGKQTGKVIATGGGAPLFQENVAALRQNGRVYLLTRALSDLATEGRPLSKDTATLAVMEQERLPFYQAASDQTIRNHASVPAAALAIEEDFYEATRS